MTIGGYVFRRITLENLKNLIDMLFAQKSLYDRATEDSNTKLVDCITHGHDFELQKTFMIQRHDGTHRTTETYECKKCGKIEKRSYEDQI